MDRSLVTGGYFWEDPILPLAFTTIIVVGEARGKRIGIKPIESLLLLPRCRAGISVTRRFLFVRFHKPPLGAKPNARSRNKKTIPRVGMV